MFLTEIDIAYIAEPGFDHVRLPLDEQQMWDVDGNRAEDAFEILHNAIRWSLKRDLRMPIDCAGMLTIFKEHNVSSANWNYKSEQFGFVGNDGRTYESLKDVILEKK